MAWRRKSNSVAWHDGQAPAMLPIALLVPAMPEQGENDDQAVEELNIEAAEAGRHNATLDERNRERADRAPGDGADAAPGRRASDKDGGDRGQEVAVAGR